MNNYPFPLDQDIQEDVEITTVDPVIKNGKVVGLNHGKRTTTQRTRYTKLSEPLVTSCSPLQHDWYIKDKHVHVAHCRNCLKRQFIRAVYERVKDGKILNRDTNVQIA